MEGVYIALFFIYGIIFGSFFNVVGLRVPNKQSLFSTGSHCVTCQRRLGPLDLIPVMSYCFLRGKCRGCGVRISVIYPLIEFMTGCLFAFAYLLLGFQLELVVGLVFISLLVVITVSDSVYMLIPNKILLLFGSCIFILRLYVPLVPWWDSLLGAAVGFCVLMFIAIVSKGGMGGGDIKLFFVIGLVLGTVPTLLTLFLSAVIGSVVGLLFIKMKNGGRKMPIPFGPSIALAAMIVYFWGDTIVEWYRTMFL